MLSPFPSKLRNALGSRSRSTSAIFAGVAALILAMGITVPSATSASAAEVDAVTDVATAPDPGNGRESVGSLSWLIAVEGVVGV
ncbi:hypothetical protein KACC15558_16590 [Brevibacterium ammoniilyticum]|uniref:Uncharacterized protein n=1 Tax=Brevibacterium ammoniilyticum TaxID=1046555 RepID=A0ABP9U0F6_9MICO